MGCSHHLFSVVSNDMRQNKDKKTQNISSLDKLPFDLQDPFKNICTLAYNGVMDNRATFSPEHLELLGLPEKLGTLGLIQGIESFTSLTSSVSYHFLHLSVQELLASFYISQLPESKQVEVFKQLFGQPRFAMVFRFYAAFTKLGCGEIREIVGNIAKEKEKTQLLYLLLGLYEAQDVSLCQFVVFHLHGHLDLSQTALSPVDCLTVGYFTSCICHAGSGKFTAKLWNCSLDDYRVTYLTKDLCRSSSSGRLRTHNLATADTEVANSSELHLVLNRNNITAEGIQSIGEILKVNQSLRTLDLYSNEIGASGAAHIAEGLRQNNHLEILDLAGNQLTADAAHVLGQVLKVNKTLRSLSLEVNQIGASGAAHIAEGLRQNNHLEILNLRHNAIADDGAAALAGALNVNHSLKTLDLQCNRITDVGARALGEALRVNQSLTELNLWSNQITDVGARALGEALRVNQSLTELKLYGN